MYIILTFSMVVDILTEVLGKRKIVKSSLTADARKFRERLAAANEETNTKRQLVVLDPITHQPIKAVPSMASKGEYKKYSLVNEVSNKILFGGQAIKKIPDLFVKKPCPPGKIVNPKTGRCIKEKKKVDTVAKKPCPPGKIVNPKTGRCIKEKKKVDK